MVCDYISSIEAEILHRLHANLNCYGMLGTTGMIAGAGLVVIASGGAQVVSGKRATTYALHATIAAEHRAARTTKPQVDAELEDGEST